MVGQVKIYKPTFGSDLQNSSNAQTVTISVQTVQNGTVLGAGHYEVGEVATLIAVPADNYTFSYWMLDDQVICNEVEFLVIATEDVTYKAVFSTA